MRLKNSRKLGGRMGANNIITTKIIDSIHPVSAAACLWRFILILAICYCLAITVILSSPLNLSEPKPKLRPQTNQQKNPSTPIRVQTSSDLSTKIVLNADDEQVKLQAARGRNQRQDRKLKVDISHMFREVVDNYPENEMRLILKQTPDIVKSLFNVINTPLDPNVNLTERVAYHYGDDYEHGGVREESICRTVTRNIYPREATRQNSLVYVPNNQDFMQVIQAELCQDPDRECNYLPDSLPYGMSSVCYQKYAYKKLLYLDPLEKRMASDSFRYPSCCSCYVRHSNADLRSSAPKADDLVSSTTPIYGSMVGKAALSTVEPSTTLATGCNDTTVQTIRSHERMNHTVVSLEDKIFNPN